MNGLIRSSLLTCLFLCLPAVVSAASPEFNASISKSKIYLNETATLRINAKWPKQGPSYKFWIPGEILLKRLEIVRRGENQEAVIVDGQEWIQKTLEIEFKPTEKGEGLIGPFKLNYGLDENSDRGPESPEPRAQQIFQFPINPHAITIKSPPFPYWKALGGASLFLVLAMAFGQWRSRRQRKQAGPPHPLTREEAAVHRLSDLSYTSEPRAAGDLIHRLALELKNFVADYYHLEAHPYTETELIDQFKAKELRDQELFTVLKEIHEIKFTSGSLTEKKFSELKNSIIRYIEGKRIIETTSISS